MMNIYQRASSKLRQVLVRAFQNREALERMNHHPDDRVRSIARAVARTLSGELDNRERSQIEQIEASRERVYASRETISLRGPRTDDAPGQPAVKDKKVKLGWKSRISSKSLPWCMLLYNLTRELRPSSCLELGTCVGISTSFQAAALEMIGNGRLCTLEGHESLAAVARANLQNSELLHRVDLVVGRFEDTLDGVLEDRGPFGLVFEDGNHREDKVWENFQRFLPHLEPPAVIVFDDIDFSPDMRNLWQRIREHKNVVASVDLTRIGIAVTGEREGPGDHFVVAI